MAISFLEMMTLATHNDECPVCSYPLEYHDGKLFCCDTRRAAQGYIQVDPPTKYRGEDVILKGAGDL